MSQVAEQPQTFEKETLELAILRLPECIDLEAAPKIMADIDRLLQPGIGLMLDFSQTQILDPDAVHIIPFAERLAKERSATVGFMGENHQVQAVVEFANFFNRVKRAA